MCTLARGCCYVNEFIFQPDICFYFCLMDANVDDGRFVFFSFICEVINE